MAKMIIVSNRLPVNIFRKKDGFEFKESLGGLATGLSSFHKEGDSIWIGWPGLTDISEENGEKETISEELKKMKCKPVYLNEQQLDDYYLGFSNKTLWPLFHYFAQYAEYNIVHWEAYREVNQLFADAVLEVAEPDDTIWIHDYHLMLLPSIIRERMPDAHIGFFLHIPFPSSELFRQMPYRNEILSGLLGADLIGFHTYDYVRHFHEAVRRILGFEHEYGVVHTDERLIKADAFPISIDYEKWANSWEDEEIREMAIRFRKEFKYTVNIVSIDRMDYSKGIPTRLEAFDYFLEKYPEYIGRVSLVMGAAPSRTGVDTYQLLKTQVDELVGKINGKYTTIDWTPINYISRSIPYKKVAALYHFADIGLVTPIRDGMNLVAKEFIATKQDGKGAIVLSENTGAAQELSEALIVNPNDLDAIADALRDAIEMPVDQKQNRMKMMQNRIERYDIKRWADDFINSLEDTKVSLRRNIFNNLTHEAYENIIDDYNKANSRLLLLDYDGTLIGFANKPEKAVADNELKKLIAELADDPKNEVTIISGRNKEFLESQFMDMPINMIAEHGIWIKEKNSDWDTLYQMNNDWKEEIKPIIELFVDRTPNSLLEEKDYSLVWHFRNVNPSVVPVRVNELKNILINYTQNLNIGIMEGNKVLEIKQMGIHKGTALKELFLKKPWDFILCIGDDVTDEYMFETLPETAHTLRVGIKRTAANYNIKSVSKVRALLNKLKDNQ